MAKRFGQKKVYTWQRHLVCMLLENHFHANATLQAPQDQTMHMQRSVVATLPNLKDHKAKPAHLRSFAPQLAPAFRLQGVESVCRRATAN